MHLVVEDRSTKNAALPLHGGWFAGTIMAFPKDYAFCTDKLKPCVLTPATYRNPRTSPRYAVGKISC